jgi:hypothetical protein
MLPHLFFLLFGGFRHFVAKCYSIEAISSILGVIKQMQYHVEGKKIRILARINASIRIKNMHSMFILIDFEPS